MSQTKRNWLEVRAVELSEEKAVDRYKRSKTASEISRNFIGGKIDTNSDNFQELGNRYLGSTVDRRVAIKYLYMHIWITTY